jgi:AraC-like DNA-binding protein
MARLPVDLSAPNAHTRSMYRERPSRLPGAVVWTLATAVAEDLRILPDGCMDLIWNSTGELFVAGPDTRAYLYARQPGTVLTGLRFAPGVAPFVLDVPAHALANQRVPLDALWRPSDVRASTDQVAASPDPGRALEELAEERLDGSEQIAAIRQMVWLIRSGRSVGQVADAIGLSERQLRRRAVDAFGYGPKMLARILRAQRAVGLARAGRPFAEVAASAGYADQAHLARDIRELAGMPLTQVLR